MSVILVTGSSRGIGAATRQSLAARGVTVIGHSTRGRAGDEGGIEIAADFTDPAAPQMLWEQALEAGGGRIDALVNNAGLFEASRLERSDIEWLDAWEDTLRINLTAAAQLSRLAVLHWLDGDAGEDGVRGRLVHVASRAAYRGDSPTHWHYAAAKGGMVAMHKTIARAYANMGVLSYAITPGFTDTSMAGDYLESRGGPGLLADIPLGRVAEPEEIASIAAFCALDAPASMTGAVIDANGASFVR
ncbi:NAD(P)-dependent dehydrogenase, short-chain alcohol dehydrogenase family [Erythrobacter litoralis]|jgi:NAD(P)-dependent dehydrogenase (short-subunit alcohol dehydrogenase family)|uniref:3-oxoacyl-ACP reductase n=1 Tax=Erythrobacter litoralis TaxID=39960 RepID=A0A074MCH2_9SPHN|nr:SDR family oxidoreductase [Erythrobacter litoralis]AOL23339.1 NAD(P)-dependent dehydrogenase, short-chain alcohol dehydrogenase family [Erythrobacter litoralis]KEO92516.1 3-oxoacyl-ACP reductase [Erythrobacter litoralis]MEE4338520.1 SDR family oxidoreductase [Erythrobacter sp.]